MIPYGAACSAVSADVAIIGDGIVGLSTAFELAKRGASCVVIGASNKGAASAAAAGLLAPSVGRLPSKVRPFFESSLERYPAFVEALRSYVPELAILRGLLDISLEAVGDPGAGSRLTPAELAAIEPGLRAGAGARFHASDGAVDGGLLVKALRMALESIPRSQTVVDDPVTSIDLSGAVTRLLLRSGARVAAPVLVLAAGAWAAAINGLPRPLPVRPLKGQMLMLGSKCVSHPVMGDEVYLVPRKDGMAVGATTEEAGFDSETTPSALEELRRAAIAMCPELESSPVVRGWAGIRPATPDMLPIIGRDPEQPALIYACGHSKNGILLAPETATAVALLAQGEPPAATLTPFAIARFEPEKC